MSNPNSCLATPIRGGLAHGEIWFFADKLVFKVMNNRESPNWNDPKQDYNDRFCWCISAAQWWTEGTLCVFPSTSPRSPWPPSTEARLTPLEKFQWSKRGLFTRIGFLLHLLRLLRFYRNIAKTESQVTPFTPFLFKYSKKWKSGYSVYSVFNQR